MIAEIGSQVSRHFLPELLEVVDCFPNPLACTQCDYQAEMSTTVALHISLVHFQLDEYLEDHDLVSFCVSLQFSMKRSQQA